MWPQSWRLLVRVDGVRLHAGLGLAIGARLAVTISLGARSFTSRAAKYEYAGHKLALTLERSLFMGPGAACHAALRRVFDGGAWERGALRRSRASAAGGGGGDDEALQIILIELGGGGDAGDGGRGGVREGGWGGGRAARTQLCTSEVPSTRLLCSAKGAPFEVTLRGAAGDHVGEVTCKV